MAIKVYCSCGKVTNVPDSYAGKLGKCPGCKQPVRVPMLETVPAEVAEIAQPAAPSASPPQSYQEPAPQYAAQEHDPYETAERGSEARFRAAPVAEPVHQYPSHVDDAPGAGAEPQYESASDEYETATHDHASQSTVDYAADEVHEHSPDAHVTNESVIEPTSEIYDSAESMTETTLAEPDGLDDSLEEDGHVAPAAHALDDPAIEVVSQPETDVMPQGEIQSYPDATVATETEAHPGATHEYDLDDEIAVAEVSDVGASPEYDISESQPSARPLEDIGSNIGDDEPAALDTSDDARISTAGGNPVQRKKGSLGVILAIGGLLVVVAAAALVFMMKKNGGSLPFHR